MQRCARARGRQSLKLVVTRQHALTVEARVDFQDLLAPPVLTHHLTRRGISDNSEENSVALHEACTTQSAAVSPTALPTSYPVSSTKGIHLSARPLVRNRHFTL